MKLWPGLCAERLPLKLDIERKVARLIPAHREFEEEYRASGRLPAEGRAVYRKDEAVTARLVQALGYMLGEDIYNAMIKGRIRRKDVRGLFSLDTTDENRARETAFSLLTRRDIRRRRR